MVVEQPPAHPRRPRSDVVVEVVDLMNIDMGRCVTEIQRAINYIYGGTSTARNSPSMFGDQTPQTTLKYETLEYLKAFFTKLLKKKREQMNAFRPGVAGAGGGGMSAASPFGAGGGNGGGPPNFGGQQPMYNPVYQQMHQNNPQRGRMDGGGPGASAAASSPKFVSSMEHQPRAWLHAEAGLTATNVAAHLEELKKVLNLHDEMQAQQEEAQQHPGASSGEQHPDEATDRFAPPKTLQLRLFVQFLERLYSNPNSRDEEPPSLPSSFGGAMGAAGLGPPSSAPTSFAPPPQPPTSWMNTSWNANANHNNNNPPPPRGPYRDPPRTTLPARPPQ